MSARAQDLLKSAIVWDNHGCMPMRADASFLPQLERYRAAGVNVASINVGYAGMSTMEHLKLLSYFRQWVAKNPEHYRLIETAADVERCKADGKLGVTFDIEGMCPVEDQVSFVQTFYELGVRWMLVAYNKNNKAGGGCMDDDTGLTARGREIIDEMQRVGMVLCLSHTGARTVMDAMDYAQGPVIFSHSNPFGDNNHVRNISDSVMQACAKKGGVIGLSGIGPFLGDNDKLVDRLLRQVRYVVDLVGADHVGLGLDYVFDQEELNAHVVQNPSLYPPGLTGLKMIAPEDTGAIAEGLARANYTDAQITGILGGNWLRIARQVWKDPAVLAA